MAKNKRLGQRHKEPTVALKAYVATPAYDGKVDTDYAISIAETCLIAPSRGIGVEAAVMGNGAFIDLARNHFVQMFLDTDCTHLFFIDADLRWEARAFIGLMESGRPVSAGVYRRRQEPEDYPIRYIEADGGGIEPVDGGWIECDRVPTGFLCIRRDIIETMVAEADKMKVASNPDVPRLFYTKVNEDGAFMGEDYCWCDDYVARYGEPIHVWPDFDFIHGGYKCNWHDYMNKVVAEIEAQEAQEEAA